jgi:diaminopimelate decarboxylase
MIGFHDGSLRIGELDAVELGHRFGTPLFVYDADDIRGAYGAVRGAVHYEPSKIHYAAVCNPNLTILRILRAEGAGLHANTPGDVYCGLRAGFAPRDIVFSGSNMGDEDLRYVLASGVHVNVDSLDDLTRACALGPSRSFGLRVHLEGVLAESRMGLRESELATARDVASSAGCRLVALHVYCGTHGQDHERYLSAVARLVELAEPFTELDCVNVGGGFGYDYGDPGSNPFPFDIIAAPLGEAMMELSAKKGRPITLRAEPGRALVAGAGVLLTRVRSVKNGGPRRYVGVDTTVANFTAPAVHGAHRRVVAVAPRGVPCDLPATICGCTTYSRDFVARDVPLEDTRVGDLLAVLDVGAYGYCMAGHFLNRPKPAEVVVDGGTARLVTRRETFQDLVRAQELRAEEGIEERLPEMPEG